MKSYHWNYLKKDIPIRSIQGAIHRRTWDRKHQFEGLTHGQWRSHRQHFLGRRKCLFTSTSADLSPTAPWAKDRTRKPGLPLQRAHVIRSPLRKQTAGLFLNIFFWFFGFCFEDEVSLGSPGCPGTLFKTGSPQTHRNPPASSSGVLACTTMSGLYPAFKSVLWGS